MSQNPIYNIPPSCSPGPAPTVACREVIPRIIYKVHRYTGVNDISEFIFVGDYLLDLPLKEIFEKIEAKDNLSTTDAKLLEETFGETYKAIFGLENDYPKQFIQEFIERDDTIEIIKGKIQLHLDAGKYHKHMPQPHISMPISLQYLWSPNCYRLPKTIKVSPVTDVKIKELPLGFFYYYNLKIDDIITLRDSLIKSLADAKKNNLETINDIPVEQVEEEIQKLELYIQESLSTKKPTKRTKRLQEATAIEEYRQVGLYTINPFLGVPEDPTSYDDGYSESFDSLFVDYEGNPVTKTLIDDQEDQILQDYLLTGTNIINLLNLVDFLDFLRETPYNYYLSTPVANNPEDMRTFQRFINGFLRKYWIPIKYPREDRSITDPIKFKLDNFVYQYQLSYTSVPKMVALLNEEKAKFTSIIGDINSSRSKIGLINDLELSTGIGFTQCYILEIVIHVNYGDRSPDFIDLNKVVDLYRLSEAVPYARYRGETPEDTFPKIFKDIRKVISKDELTRWVSDKPIPVKADESETVRYTVFGKGLSYRVKLYDMPDPANPGQTIPKFGTMILLRDGKIELKASWDESLKANLDDVRSAVAVFAEVVENINKLQYHLLGVNRKRLIGVPDVDFLGNPYSNTQLTLINTTTHVDYGDELSFSDLNSLAQCFHKTYATVIRTDINLVEAPGAPPKTISVESNTLKLRYRRISFYEEMDKYSKLIYELKQQYRKLTKESIVAVFREEFKGENLTKEKAEIIVDARLAKRIKHPGVDVRFKKADGDIYKIFIIGAKNLLQLSQVQFYIKQLLYIFKNQSKTPVPKLLQAWNAAGDCKVDIQSLKLENDEIALQNALDEAKKAAEKAAEKDLDEAEVDELDLDNPDLWGYEEAEDVEAHGQVEEEGPEDVESEMQEPIQEPGKVPPKRRKPVQEGRIDPLSRLEKADPELFETGYATGCQKSDFRQPMVISNKRRAKLVTDLKAQEKSLSSEIASGKVSDKDIEAKKLELNNVKANLESLDDEHGLSCRNDNFYFCPIAFCYTCETILMPDEVPVHQAETGHQSIYLIPPGKLRKGKGNEINYHNYVGVLEPGSNSKNLCMPCCYKKPKQKKAYYSSCINNQCLGKNEAPTTETESSNPLYVFNPDKRFIAKDRYAFLPKDLELLFNTGRQGVNCDTHNGTIRAGTKFDCYLRKGLPSQLSDVKNVFINAIGGVLKHPLGGEEFRQFLADRITPELFSTLLNGNLKVIFSDEKGETDPYGNFLDYLLNDYINEDYLWDFITAPGVILDDGFNLIIFEAQLNPNKSIRNIMLKCPLGFDLDQLYSIDRPSLILYKYSRGQGQDHYEPIYHVYDKMGTLLEDKFFPDYNPYIEQILDLAKECKPHDDAEVMRNLDEFYRKANIPNLPFEPALTARQTIDMLRNIAKSDEYLSLENPPNIEVEYQLVDSMNKVSHLLLGSGVKLPVKPSVIVIDDIPTRDYYSDEEIEELRVAEMEGRLPNQLAGIELPEIFPLLYNLNQWSATLQSDNAKRLNTVPRLNLIDESGKYVIDILMNNGLVIETYPFPIEDLEKVQVNLATGPISATQIGQDIQDYSEKLVDRSIKEAPKVDLAISSKKGDLSEERVKQVNKSLFEAETYQRLRFELSRYLQTDEAKDLKEAIEAVIDDQSTSVKERRKLLFNMLMPVFKDVLTTSETHNPNFLDDYRSPNVRVVCYEQGSDVCPTDPHCSMISSNGSTGDRCKLFIPTMNLEDPKKTNLSYYTNLLVDELVRNPFKGNEIMNDQIDTYIRREVRQEVPDELILYHKDPVVKRRQINKLYQKGIDYEEQWQTHPEIGKIRDDIEKRTGTLTTKPLSTYWQNLLGANTGLQSIVDDDSNDFIYLVLANALNQREVLKNKAAIWTPALIKDTIWNYVMTKLEAEPKISGADGRPAWMLFFNSLFGILSPVNQAYKNNMVSAEEFEELYKSSDHVMTHLELDIFSRIFGTRFIIMRDRKYPNEVSDSWIICLGTTQTLDDWYILLYLVGYEKYEIVVDTAIYVDPTYRYRYIFDQSGKKSQIPEPLYNKWLTDCPNDHKNTIDTNNKGLLLETPPIPELLRTLRTGDVYPVSPRTGKVIPPHVARPEVVEVAPPKKLFIIRKVTKTVEEPEAEIQISEEEELEVPEPIVPEPTIKKVIKLTKIPKKMEETTKVVVKEVVPEPAVPEPVVGKPVAPEPEVAKVVKKITIRKKVQTDGPPLQSAPTETPSGFKFKITPLKPTDEIQTGDVIVEQTKPAVGVSAPKFKIIPSKPEEIAPIKKKIILIKKTKNN